MPRSRAPRRRLTAALLLVLGVLVVALCGAVTTAPAAPVTAASGVLAAPVPAVPDVPAVAAPAEPGVPATLVQAEPGVPAVAVPPGKKVSAPAFTDGSGVPGCRQGGKHQGSDPAAPVRVRTGHDQAPVLEDRAAPASLGALYAAHRNPLVRGPTLSAPTPVELSVLRV
ncbi:hypothetical protein [Streptomyces sp. NPDC007172]|uniref:hypothetical protein n=1 Tax=Streptomyces sp. NPDC007172 TaxID=3364776 RepID=UPI0036985E55